MVRYTFEELVGPLIVNEKVPNFVNKGISDLTDLSSYGNKTRRGSRGGERWGGCPLLGREDPRRRRGFPRLKGRKKGHWCLLNGCSTPFRHYRYGNKHLEKLQICGLCLRMSKIAHSHPI